MNVSFTVIRNETRLAECTGYVNNHINVTALYCYINRDVAHTLCFIRSSWGKHK
jgi:hypothetical protein